MKKTSFLLCLFTAICIQTFAQTDSILEQIAKSEQRQHASLRNYDAYSVSSNNFDAKYYNCEWTVDPAVRFISGVVTSHFVITAGTNSITYDLSNALTVDSILYHGTKINFTHSANNALQVQLPVSLSAGIKDSVSIFYKGVPPPGNGYFTTSAHSGTPVMWTLSEPYGARTWWPCKDMLGDKADSIRITIHNPVAYVSSSNGLPVSETINGTMRSITWVHKYPIVSYLVAFAVTNYVVANDVVSLPGNNMPLVMYAYPESAAAFVAATTTAKFCLTNFTPLISNYPFIQERYAQTQFGYGGGMEHQTNSFIGVPNAGLVAHELAHQWFGDKVTCGSWSDLWLNEGFASYMELVYVELSNPANKINFLNSWRINITNLPGGSVYVLDTLNINRLFDARLTYRKGGYLAHMLRWVLGDSTFFRGVRRYLNDPQLAYKTARTADLQRNLEAESGLSLNEFFQDWIYNEGYPNYHAEWTHGTNNAIRIKLNQTTSHPSVSFFEMPVPLLFRNSSQDTIIRVNHTRNGEIFTVNPGFVADTIIIDPELWLLSREKTSSKVASLPGSDQLLIYPNPVHGALTISLPDIENAAVSIYNSIGQRVYSAGISTSTLNISTAAWAGGTYWVHIQGNNYKEIRKIIVVRR